jgi:hypothetical protein
MNNHPNAAEYEDPLSDFERQLRARELGASPERRGELMYQCGYAAGVSATQKSSARATKRWRLVGLVASMFACLASLSHLGPWPAPDRDQLGMAQSEKAPLEMTTPGTWPSVKADARRSWSELDAERHSLAWNRLANRPTKGILRATSNSLTEIETIQVESEVSEIQPSQNAAPLRPCDFSTFLKG